MGESVPDIEVGGLDALGLLVLEPAREELRLLNGDCRELASPSGRPMLLALEPRRLPAWLPVSRPLWLWVGERGLLGEFPLIELGMLDSDVCL